MKLLKKKCVHGFHGAKAPLNDGRRMAGQRGRSMVEMLGVLAIIGVLSIGGIAGYREAMDRNAANEIINEINILATNVSAYIQANKDKSDLNLSQFSTDEYTVARCTDNMCGPDFEDSFRIEWGKRGQTDYPQSRFQELSEKVFQNIMMPYSVRTCPWNGLHPGYAVPMTPEDIKAANSCVDNTNGDYVLFIFADDLS